MNVLIINLTRFGDLLQTQPVAHALHEQGCRVGLVCLDNFASAAELLEHVDAVFSLPGAHLLRELSNHWPASLAALHNWVHTVQSSFMPDRIINLTATPAARLLVRSLSAPHTEIKGFSLDEHGFGLMGSAWTAFFEASTRTRGCSPYNLVDIFSKAAGCSGTQRLYTLKKPDAELQSTMLDKLLSKSPQGCLGYVGLQLGASEKRRQWPAAYFAELGNLLWRHYKLMPVLLGSTAERALAEDYLACQAPGIDMAGTTSLQELAALLPSFKLLVTNDTGTMHLAAGLGVPSLSLFLATAQPWDTGPYLEGCCSLEPDMPCHPCGFGQSCPHNEACVQHIKAQAVWPLLEHYIKHRTWPDALPQASQGLRAWKSLRDADGFMNLQAISAHEQSDRTSWIRLQRHFYSQFLDKLDAFTTEAGSAFSPAPDQLSQTLSPKWRTNCLEILEKADGFIQLFIEQGKLTLKQPSGPYGQRFMNTCHRIGALFDEEPPFKVLGRLWESSAQERGTDLMQSIEFAINLRSLLRIWHQNLSMAQGLHSKQ